MEIVVLVLVLIIAVLISNIIASKLTQIPLAFIEIAIGLLVALIVPYYRHYTMDPALFMLVVLAPLMFYEGLNTNMRVLRRSLSTTFSLAVGLALVTVSIVGLTAHFTLSELALPVAFALAAIITPTDAVAVSSVTANIEMPEEAMQTLKNESLFNDASGIVIFDLALQAFTTGKFSWTFSFFDFIYVFLGGLLLGTILGSLLVSLRTFLINHRLDNSSVIVTMGLLTPFFVYFVAEFLHVSGILAVVAAGLIHGIQQGRLRLTSTKVTSRQQYNLGGPLRQLKRVCFCPLGNFLTNRYCRYFLPKQHLLVALNRRQHLTLQRNDTVALLLVTDGICHY